MHYISRFTVMKLRQLCLILLILCLHVSVISADRGDDLISLVQSETLKAHIIALQENVQQVSPRGSEQPRASGTPQKERIVYRTRSSYHRDAADNATQYIANQFRRSPRLKVEFEKFSGMKNVIAKLPPRRGSASDRIFIVCAHYDTKANRDRGWNPLTSESPGADDNATGVAAMLEIAHLLSQFEYDHELRFIAFDGEEIGLMGSRHHAKKASRAGENIVVVINIDMIGFNWQTDLVEMLIKDSDEPSVWMSEVLLLANKWYHIGLEIRHTLDGSFGGSDHKPFWDNGYRAITFVESTKPWRDSPGYRANPFYHTSRDTVDKINMRLVRKVTQLALIGLNSLASQSPQAITSSPSITIDPLPVANQNPVHITGRFESVFPVDIIVVDPGPVRAQLDRSNHTYSAEVTLRPGANLIRVSVVHPLGAKSVEQTVEFKPDFEWTSAIVFPNPSRLTDDLTQLRGEGNLPMEAMTIFIYAPDGSLVKQQTGVPDRADGRVWRVWWNHQNSSGLLVATGIYMCRFEARVNGKTYWRTKKLAIIR